MARGDRWRWALMFSAWLVSCVTNHEQLEKRPTGGGGAGGSIGASAGARNLMGGAGSGSSAMGGAGHADDEPPGRSVLTFVNGIVDAPEIALCWGKLDASAEVIPFGEPLLTPALEYGHSLVLQEITGADWAEDSLQPIVIAGDLDSIAGLDCREALALAEAEEGIGGGAGLGEGGAAGSSGAAGASGASHLTASFDRLGEGGFAEAEAGAGGAPSEARPRLRSRGLPVIVAGTLNLGRSFALIANGCLGGAGFSAPGAEAYCGEGYGARQPTASAMLVSLSRRVAPGFVGMQVVNASLANSSISLRTQPPAPSQETGVAFGYDVALGQVSPRPASIANTVMDYGSALSYSVEVRASSDSLWSESWAAALTRGGLDELSNGVGYALVFNGPQADSEPVPGTWNGPALTVIASDPE